MYAWRVRDRNKAHDIVYEYATAYDITYENATVSPKLCTNLKQTEKNSLKA